MHVPDGLLNPAVWGGGWILGGGGLAFALWKARRALEGHLIPLAGVMAAFIFAAQMLNFPVLPGVSGHLVGGALAAIVLGPSLGAVVIFVVLLIQSLLFGDGGITALGLNTISMALIGSYGGYALYRLVGGSKPTGTRRWIAAFVAGLGATVVASAVTGLALALSLPYPPGTVLGLMVGYHALIGLGEGIITALVIGVLAGSKLLEPKLEGGELG